MKEERFILEAIAKHYARMCRDGGDASVSNRNEGHFTDGDCATCGIGNRHQHCYAPQRKRVFCTAPDTVYCYVLEFVYKYNMLTFSPQSNTVAAEI